MSPGPASFLRTNILRRWAVENLNFYRIHLLCFIFIPLIAAAIFYASNSTYIPFIDCLYMCYSAMTVTGLSTINLSSTTPWQQAILFFLMFIGSVSFVSSIMVIIRRSFFKRKLDSYIRRSPTAQERLREAAQEHHHHHHHHRRRQQSGPLRADMIRRLDAPAFPVGPSGGVSTAVQDRPAAIHVSVAEDRMPRTQTIEIREPQETELRRRRGSTGHGRTPLPRTASQGSGPAHSVRSSMAALERDFGGFPSPLSLLVSFFRWAMPDSIRARFERTLTMPRTATFNEGQGANAQTESRTAPYVDFPLFATRNSFFHGLTAEQRDELGGVEYRALDVLAVLIPVYILGLNLISVLIVAPWLATSASSAAKRFRTDVFDAQVNHPDPTWYTFFQMFSSFTNCGFSLVDTSLSNMQDAYLVFFVQAFLILAGNTAYPIFLRFFIWVLSKAVPKTSRLYESLTFLLDHPRRCFVYLFPSTQTWLLFFVLVILNGVDWWSFLVLDIGNPAVESIPVGQRVADGLFQSITVRTAGFQIISMLSLAPATQVLYVIMMYISALPIALSVRSTNVYEERSLGIYESESDDEPGEDGDKVKVWGNHLAWHTKKQLAFDVWWLCLALWLVCIVERHHILDPTTDTYFNVFTVLFEIVSAYGTVGLSTGLPYNNFSLSGGFRPLSKLIIICVMIRGRHRGLPAAIDRAVLLPGEKEYESELSHSSSSSSSGGTVRGRAAEATTASSGGPTGLFSPWSTMTDGSGNAGAPPSSAVPLSRGDPDLDPVEEKGERASTPSLKEEGATREEEGGRDRGAAGVVPPDGGRDDPEKELHVAEVHESGLRGAHSIELSTSSDPESTDTEAGKHLSSVETRVG